VRKNVLERILSVVCDVSPGEGLGALILAINLFTVLGAYYLRLAIAGQQERN
jgi:ATP:ADP antiporter, AAA family